MTVQGTAPFSQCNSCSYMFCYDFDVPRHRPKQIHCEADPLQMVTFVMGHGEHSVHNFCQLMDAEGGFLILEIHFCGVPMSLPTATATTLMCSTCFHISHLRAQTTPTARQIYSLGCQDGPAPQECECPVKTLRRHASRLLRQRQELGLRFVVQAVPTLHNCWCFQVEYIATTHPRIVGPRSR